MQPGKEHTDPGGQPNAESPRCGSDVEVDPCFRPFPLQKERAPFRKMQFVLRLSPVLTETLAFRKRKRNLFAMPIEELHCEFGNQVVNSLTVVDSNGMLVPPPISQRAV